MEEIQYFRESEPKKRRAVIITVSVFVFVVTSAIVAASLLKTYYTVSFYIDGSSMLPTLDGGVSGVNDDGDKTILWTKFAPSRGDIVVLTVPSHDKPLVKRVIGVSGDVVRIDEGKVYLNGNLLEEPYILEPMDAYSSLNNDKLTLVNDGEIFVMGDNRNNSSDSRDFGAAKVSDVIGKVIVIINQNNDIRFPKKK
jgi:signal peptidase I